MRRSLLPGGAYDRATAIDALGSTARLSTGPGIMRGPISGGKYALAVGAGGVVVADVSGVGAGCSFATGAAATGAEAAGSGYIGSYWTVSCVVVAHEMHAANDTIVSIGIAPWALTMKA
jgi:hypothetical protein